MVQMRSLEECVKTGVGNERKWSSSQCQYWSNYDAGVEVQNDLLEDGKPPELVSDKQLVDDKPGSWEFNEAVAMRFGHEARTHIPDYAAVIRTCLEAVTAYFGEGALSNLQAVDVGCATGYTMLEMLRHGFRHVYGYDISQSMLDVAQKNLDAATQSQTVKWSEAAYHLHLAEDAIKVPPMPPSLACSKGNLDVVIMNWTLHFVVNTADRLHYLSQLFLTLKPGGILFLTEKTDQDETTMQMYYNWKASPPQNVSWDTIQGKKAKLKGILETLPAGWYFDALVKCGYENVTILRAKYGFVTFVCYKPKDTSAVATTIESFVGWRNVEKEAHAVSYDASKDSEPYVLSAWGEKSNKPILVEHDPGASSFGFVHSGEAILTRELSSGRTIKFTLVEGMYFACPGRFQVKSGSGFISKVPADDLRQPQLPLFTLGGPLEDHDGRLLAGRLPYIDGCTDTLLIPPVVKGAPCLNHLHFPSDVIQTQHTHPSGRTGIVVQGTGRCRFLDPITNETRTTTLEPGMVFCIPKDSPHAFETSENATLDVVAFHPDSDFGPTAADHPMVNRTMVGGISASCIPSIRTDSRGSPNT